MQRRDKVSSKNKEDKACLDSSKNWDKKKTNYVFTIWRTGEELDGNYSITFYPVKL